MKTFSEISEKLKKEIPYQWKIQSVPRDWKDNQNSTKKGTCVAYIDARDVMDVLDEQVGPGNWNSEFYQVKNTMFCRIGICVDGVWVYKSDAGSPPDENSGEDAVIKGEPSDAFKRAAVQWGIGRFLYSKDIIWISQKDYEANRYKLTEFCNKGKSQYDGSREPDKYLTMKSFIDLTKSGCNTESDFVGAINEYGWKLGEGMKKTIRHYVDNGEIKEFN